MKILPFTPIAKQSGIIVVLEAPVACRCPEGNRTDFGRVRIEYSPTNGIVEYASFAQHLATFVTKQITHESLTDMLLATIVAEVSPMWATVTTEWSPIEGVGVSVHASNMAGHDLAERH